MKRWVRLVIAAAVIAGLVVALVLVRRSTESDDEPAAAVDSGDHVAILDIPRESIADVTIERADGELTVRATGDGTFKPVYPYEVSFDSARVDRIVGSVASLRSTRVINEDPATTAEYGLDPPSAKVNATLTEGDPVTLMIGDRTPSGNAYYVQVSGNPAVYTVAVSWITPFLFTLDDLRDKTLPQIDFQTLADVLIDTTDGRTVHVETRADISDNPELSAARIAVTEPYSRPYQVSGNWLDELAKQLPSIAITRFVDDNPQDLNRYGLDSTAMRVRIADADNVLALEVGAQTDGGRYARFPGGSSVFVVSGVDDLVTVSPYHTISPFVYIVNVDLVKSVVAETPADRHVLEIEHTPAENPDDSPDETFIYDGEPMDEELARDLYQWLIGLQMDAEITSPVAGPSELTLTYTLENGSVTRIDLVPQNANYSAAYREGEAEFVIAHSKVRRLIAALEDPSLTQQ